MYLPEYFAEKRVEVLHELMRSHPLAALVTLTGNGLDANHIPLEIDPDPAPFGTLRGHVARTNPIWREFSSDVEALAIFQGPNAYISPSWYPSKQETGHVVPTWNYVVIHAHCRLTVIDDPVWLRNFVERLTNKHESGRREPWKIADAPAAYIDRLLHAIVGLEMPITRLAGKWKVTQNRSSRDREGAIHGLLEDGSEAAAAIARLIRE